MKRLVKVMLVIAVIIPLMISAQLPFTTSDASLIAASRSRTVGGDVVTGGLLAWWRFDEGSGTTVTDSSGNGKTMTLAGSPTWTTSNGSHGALQFDGSDDAGAFSVATGGTTYSISMWIFPIASSPDFAPLCIVAASSGLYYLGATRKLDYYYGGDHIYNTAISESAWHHVVITVEAGEMIMYFDNSSVVTASGAGSYTFTVTGKGASSEAFKGKISDFRIYNRALSAGEVTTLFNNP